MRRARILACAASAFALLGCVTLLPKAAPVQLYRFGGADEAGAAFAAPLANGPVVALESVALPPAAAGDGLLTVTGDQAAYVAGARWVSPAAVLMREAIVRRFAQRSGVRLVDAGTPAAWRLDILVTDFDVEYPVAGGAPTVRLTMIATLTSRAGMVTSRSVNVSRAATENRLGSIVPAYDAAVSGALSGVVGWVEAQTAGPANGAATH